VRTQVGRALARLAHPPHRGLLARGAGGGARSALSAPSRTACPRNWRWPGSPPSMPPIGGSPKLIWRPITPVSRWRRSRSEPPSSPTAAARREILCLQEEHRVGNDNTVKWRTLSLQIPPSPLRPHFVRATVRIHEYPDGRLAIFHGPHRLADYDDQANRRDDAKLAA
jgi:hypothetical protein